MCTGATIVELGNFHKLSTAVLNETLYEIYLALVVSVWHAVSLPTSEYSRYVKSKFVYFVLRRNLKER